MRPTDECTLDPDARVTELASLFASAIRRLCRPGATFPGPPSETVRESSATCLELRPESRLSVVRG